MKKSITTTLSIYLLACSINPSAFAQKAEEVDIEVTKEETQMVTFLGIETNRISKDLRNHIDLPDGVGLTISHIAEGTGAAEADLQQYDVLHKVDDQIIINQEQLKTYIRSKNVGDKVRLTILRKGKTHNVSVELGERELTKQRGFGQHWPFPNPMPNPFPGGQGDWNFDFNSDEFQERMEEFSKRAAEIGNRAMQFIPEVMIELDEEDGSKRVTSVGRGPFRVEIRKNDLVGELKMDGGEKVYLIKERDDKGKETILYEGGEPTTEELKKLGSKVEDLVDRLKSSDTFDWKNMDKLMNEKTRIIINTGEEEANIIEISEEEEA